MCVRLLACCVLMSAGLLLRPAMCFAQSDAASLAGVISDPKGALVPEAEVTATRTETNTATTTKTNGSGVFAFPSLQPGHYRVQVRATGFKEIVLKDVEVHVQDKLERNFSLEIGTVSEIVNVTDTGASVNTQDASVSTVIDRNFAENLPLNGRSFNTLLQLTPGVVIAPNNSGATSQGQFSISGQRTDANNFIVDGVSANFGVGSGVNTAESGTGGAQALSVMGSTSSLVSVDALQEFRIETSSFAPEFGRSPGGQVILSTRSGTNNFHGGIFDYFRNTVLDANDWFANNAGHPRAPEHHNDFGGFLGGPLWKNKTFFFFSYEGARLDLPQTLSITVPSKDVRASAPTAIAPLLNAYPEPNGPISADDTTAQFTGSLANPATLNATSIRIDHRIDQRFSVFGRYDYAPSEAQQAFGPSSSMSNPFVEHVNTQTLTLGLDMLLSTTLSNSLRGNYSTQDNKFLGTLDSFGGAIPIGLNLLLGPLASSQNAAFFTTFDTVSYVVGNLGNNRTRQLNLTDGLALSTGLHQLKFGGDYRAIFLAETQASREAFYFANTVQDLVSTGAAGLNTLTTLPAHFLTQSLSLYAQDTWRANPRLTLTYGLRWELSPAPSARGKTTLASFQNVDSLAEINLVPFGRPLWATTYGNFAPRFGLAYGLRPKGDFVLRAGGGIFYDLGVGSSANLAFTFPNSNFGFFPTVTLPVQNIASLFPAISFQPPFSFPTGFDPHLKLPRSYQWNVALEKSFGGRQVLTATYVGQAGRDLLRQTAVFQPNGNFTGDIFLTRNGAHSNYNALQVQFRRSLSSGLQALLNYTYSHSLDNFSNDVVLALPSNVILGVNDYASSDFDVRHSISAGVSYEIPGASKSGALAALSNHWSLQSVIVARTGFPFNGVILFATPDPGGAALSRPDRIPGQPLWIPAAGAPGGKMLNPAALQIPATPRKGTEGRNDIPGFGLTQVDLSVGRKFPIADKLNLQFRADAFNVLNHPNFRNPSAFLEFGPSALKAFEMLNQGLGGLNPLFQEGGARSLQLSLKLTF
jgi:outer membrane receptor protein involved in Fe transport